MFKFNFSVEYSSQLRAHCSLKGGTCIIMGISGIKETTASTLLLFGTISSGKTFHPRNLSFFHVTGLVSVKSVIQHRVFLAPQSPNRLLADPTWYKCISPGRDVCKCADLKSRRRRSHCHVGMVNRLVDLHSTEYLFMRAASCAVDLYVWY